MSPTPHSHLSLTLEESYLLADFLHQEKLLEATNRQTMEPTKLMVRWPWVFPDSFSSKKKIQPLLTTGFSTLFVLMQAGSAAIGFSENGMIKYHKVIKKYMVRKKQGKAQLKHLNTKGKSRLGSRIRLQQSQKFFHEIHEKIAEWNVLDTTKTILYSASTGLWPFLFSTVENPVFDQRDERLVKIPLDLQEPNFKVLQYVNKTAHKTIVHVYEKEFAQKLESFLVTHRTSN